jgi:hypothetical protein
MLLRLQMASCRLERHPISEMRAIGRELGPRA